MKRSISLLFVAVVCVVPMLAQSRQPAVYHTPEPAAVAEIAIVGAGLGLVAWRRARKSAN